MSEEHFQRIVDVVIVLYTGLAMVLAFADPVRGIACGVVALVLIVGDRT